MMLLIVKSAEIRSTSSLVMFFFLFLAFNFFLVYVRLTNINCPCKPTFIQMVFLIKRVVLFCIHVVLDKMIEKNYWTTQPVN